VGSPEHLGPGYIAAVLRNAGAAVTILEVIIERDEGMIDTIVKEIPDIIGISLTTVAVDQARQFGKRLRDALITKALIVAGGPVATHQGAGLLTTPGWEFLDGLIRGEGEIPMLRLAEIIHTGGDLSSVPNFCYRQAGGVRQTPMLPGVSQLDLLPFPARDQLFQHGGRLAYVRLSTSRGCTAHCTFCNAPHAHNRVGPATKAWRGVSPGRVVDEIEMLMSRYGCNTFDFIDSTFEDPGGGVMGKTRVREIANDILARNLKIYFNVYMQAYNWTEEDRPLLRLLWQAGLEKVCVGIESGNQADLVRWKKRSTVEDNHRIVQLLREIGVHVAFGFIAFHPWSTFESVRKNHVFLRDNVGHNLRRFSVRLELYPGSEVINELANDGLLLPSFHDTLNPYSYKYADSRILKLATCLNAIYNEEYSKTCTIREIPAVFRFETYDVVVHNFISRIARTCQGDSIAEEIIEEFRSKLAVVKREMGQHNFALVSELTNLAEADRLEIEDAHRWAEPTQLFFADRMKIIERFKMLHGLQLRRHRSDIVNIAGSAMRE
jgi:radical SAM superfamily enzyme YgiQ (UPF0313 family)